LALAYLAPDALDRLGAEGRHRPIAAAAGDAMGEVPEEIGAVRRVDHLGVEHRAVEAPLVVGHDGEGRALADRDDPEARRQRLDAVAMAHPHLLLASPGPEIGEECAFARHLDEGAAELAMVRGGDRAAELRAHRLLAIADA